MRMTRSRLSETGSAAPLASLHAEHESTAAVLITMRLLVRKARDHLEVSDGKVFRAMLYYLDVFPEREHHRKEETELFARIRARTREADAILDAPAREHASGQDNQAHAQRRARPASSGATRAYRASGHEIFTMGKAGESDCKDVEKRQGRSDVGERAVQVADDAFLWLHGARDAGERPFAALPVGQQVGAYRSGEQSEKHDHHHSAGGAMADKALTSPVEQVLQISGRRGRPMDEVAEAGVARAH
jgi:hypothetical protein